MSVFKYCLIKIVKPENRKYAVVPNEWVIQKKKTIAYIPEKDTLDYVKTGTLDKTWPQVQVLVLNSHGMFNRKIS